MKKLTLIRHAKSSWQNENLTDFARPLNKRGQKAAPLMGKIIKEKGYLPSCIIASPAVRALSTARLIAEAIDYPQDTIHTDERIYEAAMLTLLDIVRTCDDAYDDVMLVGHNPGFLLLAQHLSDHVIPRMPTCGVVRLHSTFDSWDDAACAVWHLYDYLYPKMFT